MILVISSENDISTDYFMEWCFNGNIPVTRINESEALNITNLIFMSDDRMDVEFNVRGARLRLSEINAVWFRRGYVHHFSSLEHNQEFGKTETNSVVDFLNNESKTLNNFIVFLLKQKKSLNRQNDYNANKLIVLSTAAKIGLKIPDTLITRNIQDLTSWFSQTKLITKALQDALPIEWNGCRFAAAVHEINKLDDHLYSEFYYSKFQKRIDKKYELRIFFINDEFYVGAIFPNNNEAKLVKRIVPFSLPEIVQTQLKKLNEQLGYESGSIDMIVDNHSNYYFLEINPVGQYDYLSKHCNYYLDLRIAEYLWKQ